MAGPCCYTFVKTSRMYTKSHLPVNHLWGVTPELSQPPGAKGSPRGLGTLGKTLRGVLDRRPFPPLSQSHDHRPPSFLPTWGHRTHPPSCPLGPNTSHVDPT